MQEHSERVHVGTLGVLLVHNHLVPQVQGVRLNGTTSTTSTTAIAVAVGARQLTRYSYYTLTSGAIQRKEPVSAVSLLLLAPHLLTVCPACGTHTSPGAQHVG